MSHAFSLRTTPDATVAILHEQAVNSDALNQMLCEAGEQTDSESTLKLVLDLSNHHFLGSVELGALVAFQKLLKERGARLVLAGLGAHPRGVLEVSRLDRAFEVHCSVDSALQALSLPLEQIDRARVP